MFNLIQIQYDTVFVYEYECNLRMRYGLIWNLGYIIFES